MVIENINTIESQVFNEIHKAVRRNFRRRRTIIKGFADLWQSDLLELQTYAQENDGYSYILLVTNCYSKYLFTEAVKNKTAKEVTRAFRQISKKSGNKIYRQIMEHNSIIINLNN